MHLETSSLLLHAPDGHDFAVQAAILGGGAPAGPPWPAPTGLRAAPQHPPALAVPLTARERQVLALIAQGLASSAIAMRLGTSVHTVRKHRSNMLRKLGLPGAAALAAYAVRHGRPAPHAGPEAGEPGNEPHCPRASIRS